MNIDQNSPAYLSDVFNGEMNPHVIDTNITNPTRKVRVDQEKVLDAMTDMKQLRAKPTIEEPIQIEKEISFFETPNKEETIDNTPYLIPGEMVESYKPLVDSKEYVEDGMLNEEEPLKPVSSFVEEKLLADKIEKALGENGEPSILKNYQSSIDPLKELEKKLENTDSESATNEILQIGIDSIKQLKNQVEEIQEEIDNKKVAIGGNERKKVAVTKEKIAIKNTFATMGTIMSVKTLDNSGNSEHIEKANVIIKNILDSRKEFGDILANIDTTIDELDQDSSELNVVLGSLNTQNKELNEKINRIYSETLTRAKEASLAEKEVKRAEGLEASAETIKRSAIESLEHSKQALTLFAQEEGIMAVENKHEKDDPIDFKKAIDVLNTASALGQQIKPTDTKLNDPFSSLRS